MVRRFGLKKWITIACSAIVLVLLVGYGALRWQRSMAIDAACARASAELHEDCVEALVAYVREASGSPEDRNRAIWALGELRDERALELLRSLLIAPKCDHSSYECQYELRKAVGKITGEIFDPYFEVADGEDGH